MNKKLPYKYMQICKKCGHTAEAYATKQLNTAYYNDCFKCRNRDSKKDLLTSKQQMELFRDQ